MSFNRKKSLGIFMPNGSEYTALKDAPDKSINGIIDFLGYKKPQTYTYHGSSSKSDIQAVCFKIFTREIICIIADARTTYLSQRSIKQFLVDFSVSKEYDSLRISDILDDGIENQSLTIDYLSETLRLDNRSSNGVFYAEKIKTYLYFTDGILTNYQFDDGLFPWAKNLKQHNRVLYDNIANAASKYQQNDPFLTKKEINIQAQAWSLVPHASGNEYVSLHIQEGAINFHMLCVCHYNTPITRQEFEELNRGRYREMTSSPTGVVYQLGNFQYNFEDGNQVGISRVNTSGSI
jgi:hypothetical protein